MADILRVTLLAERLHLKMVDIVRVMLLTERLHLKMANTLRVTLLTERGFSEYRRENHTIAYNHFRYFVEIFCALEAVCVSCIISISLLNQLHAASYLSGMSLCIPTV